jgi:starch synthase
MCIRTLKRALKTYQNKKAWHKLQQRGMEADFSWSSSAQDYIELYQKATQIHNT